MKKALIFIAVFLYADISNIITKIKEMEEYKRECKKVQNFNIFSRSFSKNTPAPLIEKSPIELYAVFLKKANINGKWVRVGDEVEGYYVVKITPEYVILKKGGKRVVLKPREILKVKK